MDKNLCKPKNKQNKIKIYSKFKHAKIDFFKFYLILIFLYISEENGIDDYSYIELGVKGRGNISLYYMNISNKDCKPIIPPDKIQINNDVSIINQNRYQLLDNEENKVKLIWNNKKITSLSCLFYNCINITYADFSHFNSTYVESISGLFNNCTSLTSVNFNNFIPSKIKDIRWMFNYCSALTSVDLSNFDTSIVANMEHLFYACIKLKSIILSKKFDTSNVKNMNRMFCGCDRLETLNISHFNTSIVENMNRMFTNCYV